MQIDVLRTIDQVEEPPTENHTFICLGCFQNGRVKWITGRMCTHHAQRLTWYRKKHGLPALKPWRKPRKTSQGTRTRAGILELLANGPASAKDLAVALNVLRDRILYQMHKLEKQGKVIRVEDGYIVVWGLAGDG